MIVQNEFWKSDHISVEEFFSVFVTIYLDSQ